MQIGRNHMNFKMIEKRVGHYDLPLAEQLHALENDLIGNRHEERILKLEALSKYALNHIIELTTIIKRK